MAPKQSFAALPPHQMPQHLPGTSIASVNRQTETCKAGRLLIKQQTALMLDDLSALKDDMIAFTEGHGMRRFRGYVPDELNSVVWDSGENPESWKDFVELAKASGAPFLVTNDVSLEGADIDYLIRRLEHANYANVEDVEEARWLRTYLGKIGYIQLAFPHQGIMFLFEISCEWHDRYQRLLDLAEDFGSITMDESDSDDER
jgi:hypothetical protein